MTNQLDESSQNQIIFIESVEQFSKLKKNQKFRFICKNCGKETISTVSGNKAKKLNQKRLLCKACSMRDTKLKKYGTLNITADDCTDRVFVDNAEEFDKLKATTKIQFYCRNCNILTNLTIQTSIKTREKQRLLLCKSCGTKRTNLEKYGVENPFQNEAIKDKIAKTNLEKYGCTNPNGNQAIREKIKNTCLSRYGVDNSAKSEIVINKIKQTNLAKYGTTCTLHADGIKEKVKETWIQKYGVDHPLKNSEVLNKGISTKLERYGSFRFKKPIYKYNDIDFDSSWELIFFIYHKDMGHNIEREPISIPYVFNNQNHLYYPDFRIDNKLYEIKGDFFFENGKMINPFNRNEDDLFEAKYKCALKNNVIFIGNKDIIFYIDYINNNYGKDFIKQFLS